MTPDELTQFTALAKKYERGTDKVAVLKIFSEDMHEVFQEVNDRGHSAATTAKQQVINDLSKELTETKTRADAAEGKLKSFDDKAPDVAAVRKTYEDAEKALRQQYDTAAQAKEQAYNASVKALEDKVVQADLKGSRKELVDLLADTKIGVDKEYAETVLLQKDENKNRLRVVDGEVKVLKKGSTDMYIVPAEGRTALDHFAEELGESVDAKWLVSGTGRGSGTTGSGGKGVAIAERFDATRNRVQAAEKEAVSIKTAGSGLERLGSRR